MMLEYLKYDDLAEDNKKKIIFLSIGLIILTLGFISLKSMQISDYFIRKVLSATLVLLCGYFIIPTIFISFIKPIFLFKNEIFHFLFSFFFTWTSFVLFIILKRTEFISVISLIFSFIGFIFSGILINEKIRLLLVINIIFNYGFSRFFLMIFFFIVYVNLLDKIWQNVFG